MTLAQAVSRVRALTGATAGTYSDAAVEAFLEPYADGDDYDTYAASADLCEAWATLLSRDYDVAADGATYNRSQAATGLRESAAAYRRRAWLRVGTIARGDER